MCFLFFERGGRLSLTKRGSLFVLSSHTRSLSILSMWWRKTWEGEEERNEKQAAEEKAEEEEGELQHMISSSNEDGEAFDHRQEEP